MSDYKTLNSKELYGIFKDWSFSKEMQNISRNDMWKQKYGLWTFLSAACDEAASKCYEYINKVSQNLIDVDTCNIHSLKSIAESVDLGYLCNHIKEDFPLDVMDLMNLLSIPKHYLIDNESIITRNSSDLIFGEIAQRAATLNADTISLNLLKDIKSNVIHIKNILNMNLIFCGKTLKRSLKTNLVDLDLKSDNEILDLTVNELFENIEKTDVEDLNKYQQQTLMVGDDINYFYLLINVIKQNIYNEQYQFFINTSYLDKDSNAEINMRWLFGAIINTISSNNENYIKDFIHFHFYSLLVSKIRNEKLRDMFSYSDRNNRKEFILNDTGINEYSLDDFLTKIYEYVNEDEANELLNPIYNQTEYDITNGKRGFVAIDLNLNQYLLDFVIYVRLLNNFIEKSNKINHENVKPIDFNILKLEWTKEYLKLIGEDITEFENKINNVIIQAAAELTDITLNISYVREQIKTSIQQYNFIGTKRIATDILRDFFIKNYTNEHDWGYISEINSASKIDEDIFKPLTALLNPDLNKRFSIDVIEYYDSTNYLNISSDMGMVNVGSYVSRVEDDVKYFVDSNNLIASSIVTANVYEDMYLPCSYFIKDFNNKFWTENSFTISKYNDDISSETIDYENIESFYEQFVDDFNNFKSKDEKIKYTSSKLMSLLSSIWESFALSSFDPNNVGSDQAIREKYIGNDNSPEHYANIANKYFPTIAPIQEVQNLYEATDIDSMNILYVSKIYYSNVIDSIISSTKEMLNMHDENGIPYEGWRQKYVNFHGYSTCYEYSDNKVILSNEAMKYFDFDGPWSYSLLQKVIFDKLNGCLDFSYLTKYTDVELYEAEIDDINDYASMQEYADEINSKRYNLVSVYNKLINSNYLDDIEKYKIVKIETDIYDNVFTLFKEKTDSDSTLPTKTEGPLFFRSYDMPLSIPTINDYSIVIEIDGNENNKILNRIMSNCVDFGIVNNLMWIFGKYDDVTYKLVSFKYEYAYNHIIADAETFREYKNNGMDMYSINDFVAGIYNNEARTVNLYTFNSVDALSKLEMQKTEYGNISGDIFSQDLILNSNLLNLDTNDLDVRKIEVKDTLFPSILYHDERRRGDQIEYDNSHNIWRLEEYNDKYYICYEALNNANPSSNFEYYFTLSSYIISFQTIRFDFSSITYNLSNSERDAAYSNKLSIYNEFGKNQCRALLHKNLGVDRKIESLYKAMIQYPKCSFDSTNLYVDVTPFSFFGNFGDISGYCYKKAIENMLTALGTDTYVSFEFLNDNFQNIFNIDDFADILYSMDDINPREYLNNIIKEVDTLSSQVNYIINELSGGELPFDEEKNYDDRFILTLDSPEQYLLNNEGVVSSETLESSFFLSELYENVPVLTRCLNKKIKIIVWFKNNTGITFIGDHALDLDLTCYIDTDDEKDKRVGYGNGYKSTRYITWDGDVTKGDYEYLEIKTGAYKRDYYRYGGNDHQNTMNINLNLCWHNNSEIKHDDVYITVFYGNVRQDIPIDIIGISEKACKERSIVLRYNMNTNVVTYEKPMNYLAVKLTMKHKLVGYTDGIPDLQVGMVNFTDYDWEAIRNSSGWYEFENYAIYIHGRSKFKYFDLKYNYITILFKNLVIADAADDRIYHGIKELLKDVLTCTNLKPYNLKYDAICLDDIYFGYLNDNIDKSTGINYTYYSFLRPASFKNQNLKKYNCPILKALKTEIAQDIINIDGDY